VAFTGNYTCNSFKSGLINGDFDFDTDTIKMALYTNAATLNEDTAAYIDDPTQVRYLRRGTPMVALLLQSKKGLQITPPSLVLKTSQSLPLLLRGGR
jgi:hypothetical protein